MMADLDGVIERFKNALTVKNECMQEIITMRFTEYDLKEVIYLLGELKYRREQDDNEAWEKIIDEGSRLNREFTKKLADFMELLRDESMRGTI